MSNSLFEHCKTCEHTEDDCAKCYPELGYKNTKLERDTKAVEKFSEDIVKVIDDIKRF